MKSLKSLKSLKTCLTIPAVALLMAAQPSRAAIANGSYSFSPSTNAPIWDLSGAFSGELLNYNLDFTATNNAFGVLQGAGTFNFDDGQGATASGNMTAAGKVTGSSTNPSVSVAFLLTGVGAINSPTNNVDIKLAARTKCDLVTVSNELASTGGSGSLTLTSLVNGKKQSHSGGVGSGLLLTLPGTANGGWSLTLNLAPNGTQLTGTATLTTSASGATDFTVTGSYSSASDTSNIKLKGSGGALSMVIATSGTNITVNSMKGKIYGQNVNFTKP